MATAGSTLRALPPSNVGSNRVAGQAVASDRPAVGPRTVHSNLVLGEMIMYDGLTTGRSLRQGRAMVREVVAALRRAWTTYTLNRAIGDVASMREEDYRQFGLDKAEILAALQRLRAMSKTKEHGRTPPRPHGWLSS
jgi:hypothetical protein